MAEDASGADRAGERVDAGASATTPLLQCRELWRTFPLPGGSGRGHEEQRLEVLRGVDLTIEQGHMVSIVGQSGVGKSTLLQVLGTLDRPSSGEVRWHGEDVFTYPEHRLAAFRNAHIGFVFQFHHLLAEFSALENLVLPSLIAGRGRREAEERAEELLSSVGLAERVRHKPGELSGGEQQRVAIARSLVMSPDVVFADEPTGNLDTRTSDEIHSLLVDLNGRTGTAVVVATHNVRLAWQMHTHLALRDGVVRTLGADETPETYLPTGGDEAS